MARGLRGVRAPHLKNTAGHVPETLPAPSEVRIPMSMNIGAPAKPVVSVGDSVKVGQLIGEAGGFVSAPVHSSVSGKVKSVNDYDEITGQSAMSITITSDGEQTLYEGLAAPAVTNLQEFLAAVRDSGVVGLGGAGFPTAVKLTVKDDSKLDYIIVNGAECEPYITSDTRTMIDDVELMREGIALLGKFYSAKSIIIGVEANKDEPIKKMKELASAQPGVEVRVLPSKYPQGGEKVLIYSTTGRIVPEGGLPLDVGVIVLNCTTVAAIARFVATGMPLVSKCVTVDGSAVKTPKNVVAPIGTPVRALFGFCGGLRDDPKKVMLGGPMMRIALPSLDMPVLK
ncbi:MAG: RnfABCDGE type electron transport complex subunit C, partial [Oscillospiraceae bacterium]|nr:RnfABCDGE type electron transport complex subunit C [Oscillospiraceae bacterium]